jgi:plastocyanin
MTTRLIFLLALVAAAAGCGSSSTPTTPSGSTSGPTVSIVAGASGMTTTAYNPNPIVVSRGMTVTWVNNDSITHTSNSDTNAWTSGNIAPGGSFSETFQSTGSFTYHCAIHPNMVGTVTVQ